MPSNAFLNKIECTDGTRWLSAIRKSWQLQHTAKRQPIPKATAETIRKRQMSANSVPDTFSGPQVLAQDVDTHQPVHIVEVKNLKKSKQSFTRQLRDDVDMVGANGQVDVALPPDAEVTKPLQRAFNDPGIPINRIDLE